MTAAALILLLQEETKGLKVELLIGGFQRQLSIVIIIVRSPQMHFQSITKQTIKIYLELTNTQMQCTTIHTVQGRLQMVSATQFRLYSPNNLLTL